MTANALQNLYSSIAKGDLAGVKDSLASGVKVTEEVDINGATPLMFACEKGNLAVVRELIDAGIDVNHEDLDNWTALIHAAKEGHADIVRELLLCSAEIEHREMGGWTALVWASYKGRNGCAKLLLDHGANPNIKGEHHMSSLIWAAGRGHGVIVDMLLERGAKVNTADKYGTTALVWASRRGYKHCVRSLLQYNANVDQAGMNSLTPLLAAARGNYTDVVKLLLACSPNVNAIDKDGHTALLIAAKEGYLEIAEALLQAGAYINVPDRNGDTVLIIASKCGNLDIVKALLAKYADVDHAGAEHKTALYWAVDKGHVDVVEALLKANPDTDIATDDLDTPLLRAVRHRNVEIVEMLLAKKAKVSSIDKKGDTALHIALRARHKRITELLLRNPKDGRLLYKPNKNGDTPYSIDAANQKGILTQIFGARRLNAHEDSENMLGYDLYGCALADMLSEPSLCMPITVGLFAKWGSGKSFLLNKLQDEMKLFTSQVTEPMFKCTWLVFWLTVLLILPVSIFVAFGLEWKVGLIVAAVLFAFTYFIFVLVWFGTHKDMWQWAYTLSRFMAKELNSLSLLLKVIFVNPPTEQEQKTLPIRFLFTDCHRLTSVGGEKSLASTMGSLCDAIEHEFGSLVTRVYRVLKVQKGSLGKWKHVCCVPYFIIAIVLYISIVTGGALLIKYDVGEDITVNAILIILACIVVLIVISNAVTWAAMLDAVIRSQKYRVLHAAKNVDTLKMEGFMQKLKMEVELMTTMVRDMDAFTGMQTRLVVIVDGLDSCEQEKVIQVMDTVHLLFTNKSTPFITVLAIDPHITIRAVEHNLHSAFQDSSITGMDYLRNLVHLPFYLHNPALVRQVKMMDDLNIPLSTSSPKKPETRPPRLQRRDSGMSGVSSMSEINHSYYKKKGYKQSNLIQSMSMQMSLSSWDILNIIGTDDYFSDINPRSMRRLTNIVYVTGRLLRAFNIEFQWLRLASWIYLTEEWPYRTSWIILYYENNEDEFEDSVLLKSLYNKTVNMIPTSKEIEPLIEIDRNPRKFEVFLTSHSVKLTIADLKIYLMFSINLDPYLRKIIKENMSYQEALRTEMSSLGYQTSSFVTTCDPPVLPVQHPLVQRKISSSYRRSPMSFAHLPSAAHSHSAPACATMAQICGQQLPQVASFCMPGNQDQMRWRTTPTSSGATSTDRSLEKLYFKPVITDKILSMMTVDDIFYSFRHIDGIDENHVDLYKDAFHANNINGKVLLHCDLNELKKVLQMNFGDWELFRVMVKVLRDQEHLAYEAAKGIHSELAQDRTTSPHVSFYLNLDEHASGPRRPIAKYARPGLENLQESSPDEKTNIMTQPSPHLEEVVIINSSQEANYAKRKEPNTGFREIPRKDSVFRQVKMESEILQAYFPSTSSLACAEQPSQEDVADQSNQPSALATGDHSSLASVLTADSMIVIPDEIDDYTHQIRDSMDALAIDGMSSMASLYDVDTASETNTSLYDRLRSVSESDNPELSQQAKPYDSESSSSSDDNEHGNVCTSRTNSILSSNSDVFTRVRNKILHLVSPTQGNGKIPYTITHNEHGSSPVISPRSLSGVNSAECSMEPATATNSAFMKVLPFRSLSADNESAERRIRSVSESCNADGDLPRKEPARKRLSKLLGEHLITDEVDGKYMPQQRNNVPMPKSEIGSDLNLQKEAVRGKDATVKY